MMGEGEVSVSQEKQNRISADVMVIGLLDEIAQRLKDASANKPVGIVEPLHPIIVAQERQVITPPMRKSWFSVSIVNDGPSNCWIIVNSEKSSTTPYDLGVGEVYEVDMQSPKIQDIIAYCDAGSAN